MLWAVVAAVVGLHLAACCSLPMKQAALGVSSPKQAIRDGPSQAGFAHLLGRSMATFGGTVAAPPDPIKV